MDILENGQRGSTKNNQKRTRLRSRKLVIEKAEGELCAKKQMTEERHMCIYIYKYIKNSFGAGRDQLSAVSWDINSDECSRRRKK